MPDESPAAPEADPAYPLALQDRASRLEPFEWYRKMRRESPVRYDEHRGAWDVFRYDTVESILGDHERFSSARDPDGPPSMLSSDPPTHARLRSPVEDHFAPGEVADLEPEIRGMAAELVADAVAGEERLDVVDDLARWLPTMTIAAMLGVPPGEREQFKEWSDTVVAGPQLTGGDRERLERRQEASVREMRQYFEDVLERRAEDPGEDLISVVLKHGEDLDPAEMRGIVQLLLIAGNVTTTNLIANAVWCFLEEGVADEVTADEDALEAAIEEVLRYRSPVQWTNRIATEPVTIEGHEIAAGERVRTWIGAANRDPDVFEDPTSFVPDRSPNPHLAFGRGIHFCLGAALARLEARVALSTLFDSVENPRLVETEYEPVAGPFLYGVRNLPLTYEGRAEVGA